MNPNSEIRFLKRELERWHPDASWNFERLASDSPANIAQTMIYREGKPWVRIGYAVRAMLATAGKLLELLDTIEHLWEQKSGSYASEKARVINLCDQYLYVLLGLRIKSGTHEYLPPMVVSAFENHPAEEIAVGVDSKPSTEGLFWLLTEYRRAKAVEYFFSSIGVTFSSQITKIFENSFAARFQHLDENERLRLNWTLHNYLTAEWLFSWVQRNNQMPVREIYEPLFSLRLTNQDQTMNNARQLVESIYNDIELQPVNRENLGSIILGISRAIQEVGYDSFSSTVTESGGQSGPESMLGNIEPVNVIPSAGRGICCDISVMVSKGTGVSGRLGFNNVIRKLRGHLLDCIKESKLVLILHDEWDKKAIEESRLDMLAHRARGVQFVPLLVRGGIITRVPLGF